MGMGGEGGVEPECNGVRVCFGVERGLAAFGE